MYAKPIIAAILIFATGTDPLPTSAPSPATAPVQRQWGKSKAGLSVSIIPLGQWTLTGEMRLVPALRNTGVVPASPGDKRRFFAYLLIAQGKTLYYTAKILDDGKIPNWPGQIGSGKAVQLPAVDIGGLEAFSYMRGLKIKEGYPAHIIDGSPQERLPAGKVAEVLRPGPVKVKCIAWLDRGLEGSLMLTGRMNVTLGVGQFARLPEARRKQLLSDLSARMKKDAFSAKAACADAVRMGRPAAQMLIQVVNDGKAKDFARMWALTALAGIGGKDAAGTLIESLTDSTAGVRYVGAYYGLRAKNDRFDKALTARATSGKDPMLTAWAIMGYLKFRKKVPPALMEAGVNSRQWRARAAVAETILRGRPDRSHLPILRKLISDPNEMIRRTAARAIRYTGDKSAETIGALIEALALEGDNARHAVAATLCALTKKKWAYRTDATEEEKRKVVQKWRQWWEQNKDSL